MAPVQSGYWGNVTSTIDWCENNYEITLYAAEFWNTISNLYMILPALLGMYTSWQEKLGTRFIYCYSCLLVVGIGSWCFHMTLWFEMQLFDEIPMIWGSCCLLYCIREAVEPASRKNGLLIIILFLYASVLTWIYVYLKLFEVFQAAYLFLVILSIISVFKLTNTKYLSRKCLFLGVGLYLCGVFVWSVDRQLCGQLKNFRLKLPFVLQPVTQLHAWWHFFAGYTTYLNILACCHARLKYLKIESKLEWGPLGFWISKTEKSYKE